MRRAPHSQYDLSTAVTFFLAGLGVGSLLALLLSPRLDDRMVLPAATAIHRRAQPPAL